jgi:biopolymer transport protein ExbD
MKRIARAPAPKLHCRIEMTAFSGVVLMLLFVFMTITPPMIQRRPIELAKTSHAIPMPGAEREDALIVAIQRDGKVFFDTTQVGPEDLVLKIKNRLRDGAPQPVFIKADARARYHAVAEAVEDIRNAGMDRVVLLTDRQTRLRW